MGDSITGLHVVLVNVPFEAPWLGPGAWIHVPPQGYGGIQWCVAMLADGLLDAGCRVTILGAPGSLAWRPQLEFPKAGTRDEVADWLSSYHYDLVHDHSNMSVFDPAWTRGRAWMATHHWTGAPRHPANVVFLSFAQRRLVGWPASPVIRLPVDPARFQPSLRKWPELLFLGRVSPWKGAYEAALFARAACRRLVIAGPVWEADYAERIRQEFGTLVEWAGEVGGEGRRRLLAEASALLVLSQPVPGPWGGIWSEPGAMVVAEAAASGTPVIGSDNGCLAEIVPPVGAVISASDFNEQAAATVLASLPSSSTVRREASVRWGHVSIAREYLILYRKIVAGEKI